MFEKKIKKMGGGKPLLALILVFGLWGCLSSDSSSKQARLEPEPEPSPYSDHQVPPDSCFVFDSTDANKINEYYFNEDDNSDNPECPTDIIIPDGVTVVGESAFDLSPNLNSVIIPDSVTSIEAYAFYDISLTSVIIGSGITSIGAGAFRDNPDLTVCIETAVANITFLGLEEEVFSLGVTPTYETDGDCTN